MELGQTSIAENTLYYTIHLPESLSTTSSHAETTCALISRFANDLQKDYLWHQESFNLYLDTLSNSVRGQTHFGDCIDDEWFIIYILFEISKTFNGTVISIFDSDGDILLIEAANVLPNWIAENPNIAENRVWIHAGQIHLIDINIISGDISIQKALEIVRRGECVASKEIQYSAMTFIREYPSRAKLHMHNVRVMIPRNLAYVIENVPQSISLATESFYLRDPISLKACLKMEVFPPKDIISMVIPMTKTLYAQLKGQKFVAPRIFLPLPNPSSEDHNAVDIGVKLTCGYEMFLATHLLKSRVNDMDPEMDPNWSRYIANLTHFGYFGTEIVGSKRYQDLMKEAKILFTRNRQNKNLQGERDVGDIVREIDRLAKEGGSRFDWRPSTHLQPDSDEWLYVDEETILKSIEARGGVGNVRIEDFENQDEMNEMMKKFEKFINTKEANIEGVEMNDNDNDENEDEDEDEEMESEFDSEVESEDERIQISSHPLWNETHDKDWGNKAGDKINDEDEELNLDMGDFIEFSRVALGLTEEQFRDILQDREKQGKPMIVYDLPKKHPEEEFIWKSIKPTEEERKDEEIGRTQVDVTTTTQGKVAKTSSETGEISLLEKNTNLDSFDSVMDAMDAELAKVKKLQRGFDKRPKDDEKGKGVEKENIIKQETNNEELSSEDEDEIEMDYNLLKNMLESIKSQPGGLFDGPAGNFLSQLGSK